MEIDRRTLRDLEVLDPPGGGAGLLDLLDRTRTPGGRARLRARLLAPSSDPAEIRETQRAVGFAAAHPEPFRLLPDGERARAVEAHLDSSYAWTGRRALPALAVEGWWTRRRYPEMWAALAHGVVHSVAWIAAMRDVAARLSALDPPPALAALADEAAAITAEAERRIPLDPAGPPGGARVLREDRAVRSELREPLRRLLAVTHELDALAAMGETHRRLGLAFPTWTEGPDAVLRIRGMRHPFVPDAVPNDLDAGGAPLVFLTGPNMAGKTTYLKGCALCVLLAHAGIGVPAAAMELAPFDALLASIATLDDVRKGYSFFYAEVLRAREAAALLASGRRTFLVFDEPFRGTNVHDARDATRLVAEGLARCRGSVSLLSSHLAELAEPLGAVPGIGFRCFEGRLEEGEPVFDHRVRDGVSAQRLGMTILRREGVPELLEAAARGAEARTGAG